MTSDTARRFVPASVNHAKAGKVQPDRQALEPADGIPVGGRALFYLAEKFRVLVRILRRVTSQKVPDLALSSPANGVELVISQDRAG